MSDRDDHDIDGPYARPIKGEPGKPDQLKGKSHGSDRDRQEDLIDEGVEESFPASDPVSVKRIT